MTGLLLFFQTIESESELQILFQGHVELTPQIFDIFRRFIGHLIPSCAIRIADCVLEWDVIAGHGTLRHVDILNLVRLVRV